MVIRMVQWNGAGSLCSFVVASVVATLMVTAVSALSGQRLSSSQHFSHQRSDDIRQLYIDTLKKSVTGILLQTEGYKADGTAGLSDLQRLPFNLSKRTNGLDFPVQVSKAFRTYLPASGSAETQATDRHGDHVLSSEVQIHNEGGISSRCTLL